MISFGILLLFSISAHAAWFRFLIDRHKSKGVCVKICRASRVWMGDISAFRHKRKLRDDQK